MGFQANSRMRHYVFFVAMAHLLATRVVSQQSKVLLNDSKASVKQVRISPGGSYRLLKPHDQTVWIAIDPVVLLEKKEKEQTRRQVLAGSAATVHDGEQIDFKSLDDLPARIVVVEAKLTQQELTVSSFDLKGSLEDASQRNATLIVAISNSHFLDIPNRGNESEWLPGKGNVILIGSGNIKWIEAGIHHFKNLGRLAAKLVTIE